MSNQPVGTSEDGTVIYGKQPIEIGELIKQSLPEMEATFARVTEQLKEKHAEFDPWINKQPATLRCLEHDDGVRVIDTEASFAHFWKTEQKTVIYGDCSRCREEMALEKTRKRWMEFGLPKKVALATFDNYEITTPEQEKNLIKIRKQVAKRYGFIVLCGNHGNGKSHIGAATVKHIGSGLFVTHNDLVDELRASYNDGSKDKLIEKYRNAKCLVLDELGLANKGDDVDPMLYSILAFRYDRDLLTVLTTNEDLATVLAILGKKLEDRIANDYTIANFTGESYRRRATKSNSNTGSESRSR